MARRKTTLKRVSREKRAHILAVADQKGLTALQVEKKFGISRWTFYGWRKRKPGRAARGAASAGMHSCNCAAEIQAVLPGLIRQELTAAMRDLLLGSNPARRGRRRS